MTELSKNAQNLTWLVNKFVDKTFGVSDVVLASADGILLVKSEGLSRDQADQLTSVAAGLASLGKEASRVFTGGNLNEAVLDMDRHYVMVSISDESVLAALAEPKCDFSLVKFDLRMLADAANTFLTPAVRAELIQHTNDPA